MAQTPVKTFWQYSERRLRFTREGKILVGIALAVGFAAINTGNNLLFFGWGLLLSAITLSGVLSEAVLRVIHLETSHAFALWRVGETALIPLALQNTSRRLPAYALEIECDVQCDIDTKPLPRTDRKKAIPVATVARTPYVLRLAPSECVDIAAKLVPARRGCYRVRIVRAKTAYPFGFFEKTRIYRHFEREFWCAPRAVDVQHLLGNVLSHRGGTHASTAGQGDDFFALRPFREGDDPRRIHWPRSARSGRPVLIEAEANHGYVVILDLIINSSDDAFNSATEHAIAVCGSLAEELLKRGYTVGVQAPGFWIAPSDGGAQAIAILLGLARLSPQAPSALGQTPDHRTFSENARIAIVAAGAPIPSHAAIVVQPSLLESRAS